MIIIGEKINATRKSVKHALLEKDAPYLTGLAKSQVHAGADYVDVNVGTGTSVENEARDMEWLVSLLQAEIEKPLCHRLLRSGST